VNYAQNYMGAQLGGQSVTGGIVSDHTTAPIGGWGQNLAQSPFAVPGGTLATTVVGSSNTGTIDVGLQAPATFNGLLADPSGASVLSGTTTVMVNGSANAVSINGSVVAQPDSVPAGPGAIATSATGAVNFGSTKLVSARPPPLLPVRGGWAFDAGGTP
jgi:hypothetical protein